MQRAQSPTGIATTPKGRPLSRHYVIDHGEARNIPGSTIDEAIDQGAIVEDLPDRIIFYDEKNNITVVQGKTTAKIMSARKGRP